MVLDLCMEKIAGVECDKGRQIAIDIFLSSKMMRNHLVLGTQEIRGEIKVTQFTVSFLFVHVLYSLKFSFNISLTIFRAARLLFLIVHINRFIFPYQSWYWNNCVNLRIVKFKIQKF